MGKIGRLLAQSNLRTQEIVANYTRVIGGKMSNEPVEVVNLRDLERAVIEAAVSKYPNRKSEVARALGITLKTLYNKLHSYGGDTIRPHRRTAKRKSR